ncbi:MAG TPA: hypothetical protein V6C81_23945 [Planktothrix sp.]
MPKRKGGWTIVAMATGILCTAGGFIYGLANHSRGYVRTNYPSTILALSVR